MLQPHLKIDKVDKYVILPGDPGRIDRVLKYLTNVEEINMNREFRTCRGEYRGSKVSLTSSGIGCPAAAIAIEELANIGAKTCIRLGTCGGLLKEMQPGDIVIPSAAICLDGTTQEYTPNVEKIQADQEVVNALVDAANKMGVRCFMGVNRTHDAFYEPIENFVKLAGKGIISSEMECSAVFLVSKLRNLKAGAILVVNTPEPPEEVIKNPEMVYRLVDEKKVQEGMENAIKITLEAVKILMGYPKA